MRFPVEIDVRMDGSATLHTRLAALAPITIQLAMVGYLPLTSTLIFNPTNPQLSIWRISYDYLPDVIEDLSTLYLLEKLLPEKPCGDGCDTRE